ncbi:MAG: V-type ATPase subunit [Anaerolineae bacterium]|nr:V-type ATPase subunit [Anaerolineae bacterium]
MKSRLLSRRDLDALSDAGSLRALTAALAKTPYRRTLEAALVRLSEREAILVALRDDLEMTVTSLRRFYSGGAAARLNLLLSAYDVRNLKAVLRGLSSHATLGEIRTALMPAGTLAHDVLAELAQAPNARAAIDSVASMGLPFAAPLLRLRAEKPGATTQEMELRLDQWYFEQALEQAEGLQDETVLNALRLEADLVNVQTVLRLAGAPEEQDAIKDWLGTEVVNTLFVGPGRLPFELLARAARQESVAAAVEILAHTAYGAPLAAGMERYRRTGRLSSLERQLHRHRLALYSALIARQPLAIGVVLGYLALKMNEVDNLRWITNATHLGMKPTSIRAELVYAS